MKETMRAEIPFVNTKTEMPRVAQDPYRWVVLVMGVLVVFGALGLARFGYSAILPSMQQGLHMNNTQAGMLATANLAGYLVLSVLGGALSVFFGTRTVVTAGLLIVGAGMLLTGTSAHFTHAALWRTLTGFGSGAANVAIMGMWAAWFEPHRRGLASGIAVTGSSFALMLTGPLVPSIVAVSGDSGWRICWYLFGIAGLILAILGYFVLRDHPRSSQTISNGPGAGQSRLSSVYRSFHVWRLGLVYIAFGFSYIIYMTFFVKYLMADCGFTKAAAGNMFMLMGICSLLCGLVWGSVSDRIGRKLTLAIIFCIQSAAFALFAFWPSLPGIVLSSILFGFTAWSIPAIMAAACGDLLGGKLAPAGLGFITLFFGIGQAIAPGIAGALADAFSSFGPAFILAASIAFLGAIGSLTLKRSN